MSQPQRKPYGRAEHLAWEATLDERWEFFAGRIKLMAGGTAVHNVISGNVFAALHTALRGGPCVPFQQNQKLAPSANEDVMYPDVLVTCRPFADGDLTLADATVIVEVLSKSTRQDDLGDKWESYQTIADLRHYVVLETDRPTAVVYHRASVDEPWRYVRLVGLDATLDLDAINVSLPLREVYAGTSVASAAV